MKWAWARLLVPLEMEERKIRPYSNFNILDKENPCTIHLKKKIRPYFNSNVLDKENPCTFHLKFFLSIYLLVRYSLRTYRSKEILTPMLGFIESRYLCVINVFSSSYNYWTILLTYISETEIEQPRVHVPRAFIIDLSLIHSLK